MYKRSIQSWRKHIDFIILDLLTLQIAYFGANIIRNGATEFYRNPIYYNTAIVASLICILTSIIFKTFKNVLKRGLFAEWISTFKHVMVVILTITFYLFSIQQAEAHSRLVLYITAVFYCFISYTIRIAWKYLLKKYKKNIGKRSLLIITEDFLLDKCIKNINSDDYKEFVISGIIVCDKDRKGDNIQGYSIVENYDQVLNYLSHHWIDEVFINISPNSSRPDDLIKQINEMGIVIHIRLARKNEIPGRKQFVERLGAYTVLTTTINYATPGKLFAKRVFDIAGGFLGTFITAILCVFMIPIIKIQSPGPAFFVQNRVGKNGRIFRIYKFRTMYLDAEERKKELMDQNRMKDGFMFKLDFDPRIIGNRVLPDGRQKSGIMEFCRRMSLDEFPQFLNVLKGDMSLVGTRPPTVEEYEQYLPHHHARLAAKPGITGMWQVSGRSNIVDFEEVVRLDTQYIREWSIGLDIKILLKTIAVVLKQEGSM